MKILGDTDSFAIGIDMKNKTEGKLCLFIKNNDILQYKKNSILYDYEWDLLDIYEWFKMNIISILTEENYPVKVDGCSGVEKYNNSFEFDSKDDDKVYQWYEKVQDWAFRHSWFSARAGSFLANIYFRKVGEMIEISWNNNDLFENMQYVYEKGVFFVEIDAFRDVVEQFIENFEAFHRK